MYAGVLRERGLHTIHVQTRDPIPSAFASHFVAKDHDANYLYRDDDFERCLRSVAAHRPLCVIPGIESGVMPADRLSEALGGPTNGTALSKCRRDKFEMQRRIQEAGLGGIRSCSAREWPTAEAWIRSLGKFPVVLKPPASAATQLNHTCTSLDEAKQAFDRIISNVNLFAEKNDAVVIQPFVRGDEYIVNTVSCAGHHVLMSVWRIEKIRRDQHTLYDHVTLQPYETQLGHRDFTFGVLDALGIRYGAGHTEMFATEDGPCLIEIGARLGGQKGSVLAEKATGRSTVEAVIDSYIAPGRFFAHYTTPYQLNRHACRVDLVAPRTGTLAALPRLDEIRALPSFDELSFSPKLGGPIRETVDVYTIPGFVDLLHPDPAVIERDRLRIRQLESDGFYVYAEEPRG